MKYKIIFTAIIVSFLVSSGMSYGFMPPSYQHNHPGARVNLGLNYGNRAHITNQTLPSNSIAVTHGIRPANHVRINNSSPYTTVVTPPPPPPIRHTYRYRDFAGERRFPRRSYYIPSYCMPETGFNIDIYNPFCNHYRPYGSNMYLGF